MSAVEMKLTAQSIEVVVKLTAVFNDAEKVKLWLITKNLNFGNISPLYLINCGRSHRVLQFIDAAKLGL